MPDFGIQVPVVLYPRFTTLYGTLALEGYPIDVSAYEAIHLNTWTTPVGGGGVASLTLHFFESLDRVEWEPIPGTAPLSPTPGVETPKQIKLGNRWFRVSVVMTGADPIATLWLEGFLIRRQS